MRFHLYYGDGKGKTTAAIGQALRAWGRGWRVLIVQFLKDADDVSGEVEAAKKMGRRWRLLRSSLPCPVLRPPSPEQREALKAETGRLLERAIREMGSFDAVILDEILAAWKFRLLRIADINRARQSAREAGVRLLVATGRWAPPSLISRADLVTEMEKIKHPFDRGEKASDGIDF